MMSRHFLSKSNDDWNEVRTFSGVNEQYMRSVGRGVVIVVSMIGIGETGLNVVTLWMGDDVIRASEMRFGLKACTVVTC